MNQRSAVVTGLGVTILVSLPMGAALIAFGTRRLLRERGFTSAQTRTVGNVIDMRHAGRGRVRPVMRFYTEAGVRYDVTAQRSVSSSSLRPGNIITIVYESERPEEADLAPRVFRLSLGAVLCGIGLVLLALAVICIIGLRSVDDLLRALQSPSRP